MKNKFLHLLMALNCLLLAHTALAWTVTSYADEGPGSLREAIRVTTAGDTITFAPGLTGTITLTSGELAIGHSLNIVGPGAKVLTIDGNNQSRVFNILSNTPYPTVNIANLTIHAGHVIGPNSTGPDNPDGGPALGGGIFNSGTLVLNDCSIAANYVSGGDGGQIESDHAPGSGGDGIGAGIYSVGMVAITNCTFYSNIAKGGSETGDPVAGLGGNGIGGAIYFTSGFLVNCTFAWNYVFGGKALNGGSGGDGRGGGIAIGSHVDPVELISCTIARNASQGGDGLYNGWAGKGLGGGIYASGLWLENTIVGDNGVVAGSGPFGEAKGPDVIGSVNSGGFNLIGKTDDSDGWIVSGTGMDLTGTIAAPLPPRLVFLGDNGGPTPTIALSFGSQAIDAGINCGLTTDQRGYSRPYVWANSHPPAPPGDGSDIGAFELHPTGPFLNYQLHTYQAGYGSNGMDKAMMSWVEDGPGSGMPGNKPAFGLLKASDLAAGAGGWMGYADDQHFVRSINGQFVARQEMVAPSFFAQLTSDAGTVTNQSLHFIPSPMTLPASSITQSNASLNATLTPVGNTTKWWFEYGTDTNYGQFTMTNSLATDTNPASILWGVAGLAPLTLYHCQIVVTDDWSEGFGLQYGGDQTFTTLGLPPVVTTQDATLVSSNSMQLNGTVNPEGTPVGGYFLWYFQYWHFQSCGDCTGGGNWVTNQTPPQFSGPADSTDHAVNYQLASNLTAGVTYYYRTFAENGVTGAHGGNKTFQIP
jgi:hypothetical protein